MLIDFLESEQALAAGWLVYLRMELDESKKKNARIFIKNFELLSQTTNRTTK